MTTVNIYLTFDGNCEEAFNFYKSVFGGEFSYMGRFKDMPAQEGQFLPSDEANRIMHVGLPISKETVLMGSDNTSQSEIKLVAGNNFSISVTTFSKDEADRLYHNLSKGGNITMPITLTFWGDYFGMFTDKFGINWMVAFDTKTEKEK